MATSITANQFSVQIIETLLLDGVKRGSRIVSTESSIGEASKRIMQVTHSSGGTSICKFADDAAAGTYDKDTFKYLRITNLDSTDGMILQLVEAGGQNVELLVPPKKSFILNSLAIDSEANIDDYSVTYIDEIIGKATGSSVIEIEYIVINT